jgi:hypothetical protein
MPFLPRGFGGRAPIFDTGSKTPTQKNNENNFIHSYTFLLVPSMYWAK